MAFWKMRRGVDGGMVLRAFGIGFSAGLRSMAPHGVLAWRAETTARPGRWRQWWPYRSTWARRSLMVSTIGEMVGDKLPGIPPRTDPNPLVGRILSGACAGMVAGSARRGTGPLVLGALFGSAGAVAGSFAGYRTRQAIVQQSYLPDAAVALAEDGAAIGLARASLD